MAEPLIAWTVGETLFIDGKAIRPGGLPRGSTWGRRCVYLVGDVDWPSITRQYLRDGDEVAGPSIGEVRSASVATSGLPWRLMTGAAWGLPAAADDASETLSRMMEAVSAEGWRWSTTAASLASRIGLKVLGKDGTGVMRQTRPRWRPIASESMHPGPQAALSGGAPYAVQLDRVAAYLQAMRTNLPTPGTWRSVEWGTKWTEIRSYGGFIRAIVNVPQWYGNLPPLPITTSLGTKTYPVGRFYGSWPIRWLAWAEEAHGASVELVCDAAICATDRHAEPLADRFEDIQDSSLRKLLYQRWWGKLASPGWFRGCIGGQDGTIVRMTRDRHAAWTWAGRNMLQHDNPPDYRPDWSAYIAAQNAVKVHELLTYLEPHSVHMVHVDAVWTSDMSAVDMANSMHPDEWKVKGFGPLRVYGTGTYQHGGGRLRAMGVPSRGRELTPADLDGGRAAFETYPGRTWQGDPLTSQEATSSPPWAGDVQCMTEAMMSCATWDRRMWTRSDWWSEEEPRGYYVGRTATQPKGW